MRSKNFASVKGSVKTSGAVLQLSITAGKGFDCPPAVSTRKIFLDGSYALWNRTNQDRRRAAEESATILVTRYRCRENCFGESPTATDGSFSAWIDLNRLRKD
jgi:hypothetical protein